MTKRVSMPWLLQRTRILALSRLIVMIAMKVLAAHYKLKVEEEVDRSKADWFLGNKNSFPRSMGFLSKVLGERPPGSPGMLSKPLGGKLKLLAGLLNKRGRKEPVRA